jgi:hypothetical protein
MATVNATFVFGLPEDIDTDQLLIYTSATETGTYTLDSTVPYVYGTSTYELADADDLTWYKIQFNNSITSKLGPLSEPVYGGNFDQTKPFLAVSTGSDGANYATQEDVYRYAGLTPQDVSRARVSQALRRARAIVDFRTAELNLERFTMTFDTDPARKKFNATMLIVREAEINIALGNVYRGMADDKIVESMTDPTKTKPSVSIGSTSIGEEASSNDTEHATVLLEIANRYLAIGASMLASIQPTSVRLHAQDDGYVKSPRFKLPFNGY